MITILATDAQDLERQLDERYPNPDEGQRDCIDSLLSHCRNECCDELYSYVLEPDDTVCCLINAPQVILDTARARIQAGMVWLDEHYPDHVDRVNLASMDVSKVNSCPLAQAGQDTYGTVTFDHYMLSAQATELGFMPGGSPYVSTAVLTPLWIEAYEARKALSHTKEA
jgi:hypothetical protein